MSARRGGLQVALAEEELAAVALRQELAHKDATLRRQQAPLPAPPRPP
jgi:hypothetical protein